MIRPPEIEATLWEAITAAAAGDAASLRRLLESSPSLHGAVYWYTSPLHFAVREGHLEAARALLEAGADPTVRNLQREDLVTIARDRNHDDVARLVEKAIAHRQQIEAARSRADHPIHAAADANDAAAVRTLLDRDPLVVHTPDRNGATPLHRAAAAAAHSVARLLLDRGADPNWPEPWAPRGTALHAAARAGDRAMVELLLDHGADPNGSIDSVGSATYAARTPDLRALLLSRGGTLDAHDLVWLDEDDEVVRRVTADPRAADTGCGGALAAACTRGKRDLVVRLLDAGARVPPLLTACRSYLLEDPGLLRLLLGSGMNPDLPNWQRQTPLHDLCGRDGRGRAHPHREACAAILLDAGADISARDDEYRSTPLAWASRNDLPDMVELLLARGAPVALPDDAPWATPLAWAAKRGHTRIVEQLVQASARS